MTDTRSLFDEFADAYNACHDALQRARNLAWAFDDRDPNAAKVIALTKNIEDAQQALLQAPDTRSNLSLCVDCNELSAGDTCPNCDTTPLQEEAC